MSGRLCAEKLLLYEAEQGSAPFPFCNEQCANCPYQDQCKPKIFKRVAKIVTSKAAHERAKIQRKMSSEEFKNYARLRNGVETVPSNIRRNYHLEKMPRGKQRGKFFFGSKIAALNFRKLFNYVKGSGKLCPKSSYLHKPREEISGTYARKPSIILQNMNFSRYYRYRAQLIYSFRP